MTADADLKGQQYATSFDVAKSMRYHTYRRHFFDGLDKVTKILTVATGGATFLVLVSTTGTSWAKALSLFLAGLTAFDVIFGFSNSARLHDKLYRDFASLARDIVSVSKPSAEDVAKWSGRRLEIETEEPTVYDWLERRCCREEAEARGAPVDQAWILPLWKIRLSQFVPS